MTTFRLNPLAARWLRGERTEREGDESSDWDAWLLQRMSRGEVVDVGGVLVDRAVLRQPFACLSQRCAPGPERGRSRSCCADLFVSLSRAEDGRLARHGSALLAWLKAREPRLVSLHGKHFYRQEGDGELGLVRPGGRCVFSGLDAQGRIRCHLHAYAKQARIERGQLQPLSCRLFPLVVVDRGDGRVLLTVVARHTRRLVSSYPIERYPCLADASLPPIPTTLAQDLDWLFGKGFARALSGKNPELS